MFRSIKFLLNLNNKKKNKLEEKNRLKLINYFLNTKTKPIWMTIKYLPVLPPELRPILKLQDNVVVTSDLNFLYAKIINSTNRMEQLKNMRVNQKFVDKEKSIIQDSIDLLINNSSRSKKNKPVRM